MSREAPSLAAISTAIWHTHHNVGRLDTPSANMRGNQLAHGSLPQMDMKAVLSAPHRLLPAAKLTRQVLVM
jgi:hypothetical protein